MSKKQDMKALSRGISRDMSPEAILKRLRIASSLHRAARMLGKARYVGKVGTGRGKEADGECRRDGVGRVDSGQ